MFYIRSKKICMTVFTLFILIVFVLGFISLVDKDKTVSTKENRSLAAMPSFSVSSLFDGSYISGVEDHYSDTFPFRDQFLDLNAKLSNVLTKFSAGDNGVVVVNTHKTGDDFNGQSLQDVEEAQQKEQQQ